MTIDPPADEAELLKRARALVGLHVEDLAQRVGANIDGAAVRTKGKVGELVERALGATAGSAMLPDFPHLGIELKTIPMDHRNKPRESTFVCAISLRDADRAEWSTSWVKKKLARVLWIPIETIESGDQVTRTIGAPRLWSPNEEEEAILRGDFDDLMGAIGMGAIERISARDGVWLQVRPKAANGRSRTRAFGHEGEAMETVPRGFYLRAKCTELILNAPR